MNISKAWSGTATKHGKVSLVFTEFNENPVGRLVGDCSVRAVSLALGVDWETAYAMIAANGFAMGDMPSSDSVWGSVLRQNGFRKEIVRDGTIGDFARKYPQGIFVLGTGTHVATVIDGDLYDAWDSSNEIPIYVWRK